MPGRMSIHARIDELVRTNDVVLFMKGTRTMPQCGFSASVVTVLDEFLDTYATVDVLADPEIREGVKEYSSWPTIPQLYVRGEFVGGADIVREMMASGELEKVLGAKMKSAPTPTVTVTEAAIAALREFMGEGASDPVVRLSIDGAFRYGMDFDEPRPGDVIVEAPGFVLLLDRASARRADGITVDFLSRPDGGGFKIDNPNEPPKVHALEPETLKRWMDEGKPMEVLDVRSPEERATAAIEGTRFLDDATKALAEGFDRDLPVVFYCHHGARSQRAAEHFLRMGFRQVYNLSGGIDAWSREVDPSVPRY
jgi:monothiol glutaredoxin